MQISQASACNRFHQIEARLARWLLMTQDRMHADEFQITQEFMSNMLGVRREAVNLAAGGLQRRGLIKYTRGNLAVLNCGDWRKPPARATPQSRRNMTNYPPQVRNLHYLWHRIVVDDFNSQFDEQGRTNEQFI